MRKHKRLYILLLMASSIVLLLVLQILWLGSAYNAAFETFRKETNALFRSTIVSLNDSLILKGFERVPAVDTVQVKQTGELTRISMWNRRVTSDTLLKKVPVEKISRIDVRDSIIQVFIAANPAGDSVKKVLRPIITEVRKRREPGNFIFRISSDTLSTGAIQRAYTDTLKAIGIMLEPDVNEVKPGREKSTSRIFLTEPFFLPHTPAYQARFENIRPMLLAKISPQIAFSVVLTILTITAFVFMYRSIQIQQKLMQLKNDLISNITHELKTPVATVSVALEALQNFNGLDNPQLTREYLQIAKGELNRLTLITEKILKTSAFEENGLTITTEVVDFADIIERVLSSLKLVFEKHSAKVTFNKTGTDFRVIGNAEHLPNVIYNLLDNAIKYSKQSAEITIELQMINQRVVLSVSDNGIGVPAEYRNKIFEKFFRVPQGDVHNAKGYGLGLSYVTSVINHHGGTIRVESEPGKGSRFIIEMPAAIKA
ncbi:MAG: HAMP domain-containing histidine kinase [Flammeovirgaceae bacterium]|nr:MAG: HAMP domain-containing histidine kinase [Flammeovirgaceae bacterium]